MDPEATRRAETCSLLSGMCSMEPQLLPMALSPAAQHQRGPQQAGWTLSLALRRGRKSRLSASLDPQPVSAAEPFPLACAGAWRVREALRNQPLGGRAKCLQRGPREKQLPSFWKGGGGKEPSEQRQGDQHLQPGKGVVGSEAEDPVCSPLSAAMPTPLSRHSS